MRLTAPMAAILTCLAWPAAAVTLCPDDDGEYTPDACDFILPIEPVSGAIECDMVEAWAGQADPVCVAYWKREAAAETARARLLDSLKRSEIERQDREEQLEQYMEQLRAARSRDIPI